MRYQNLFRGLGLLLALFVSCANAQTVAIAHVIYDGEGLYYADNEENIQFKPLEREHNGTYTVKFKEERLKTSAVEARKLRFGLKCTEGKKDCETYLYKDEASLPTLKQLFPDYIYQEKDQPVYEVWLKLDATGITVLPGIPEEYVLPDSITAIVRVLPPWNNTSALIYVDGEKHTMVPIRDTYCGWFVDTLRIIPKDAYVYFKQSIGDTYLGKDGVSHETIPISDEIALDSILAISNEVWISAKYGYPELSSSFPGDLGDCPIKKLPVMMFDWLHGDGDGKNGYNLNEDDAINAKNQAGTTNQDFGTGGCDNLYTGMVDSVLGPNGVPVRAANFPANCKLTEHLNDWFLPEVVATGADGKKYTNVTCRELELEMDNKGFWKGQRNIDSPEKGLFLLDDFKYLDEAQTVPNPHFDWISGGKEIGTHNYGFTMKIQAQFEYVKGQYFEFYGDDDVWVFINNKLVVDIGGQHHQSNGSVDLDKLGLTEGETYPFHIFYAERHKDESNFKMRTSIDLQTDASMLLAELSSDTTVMKIKDVYQIIRERELACDFSSSPETERTELGPSNFVLFGKGVSKGGVALKVQDSTYYGGITIAEKYTRLTIDIDALSKAMLLPPGTYYVRISLQSNKDEYKDVYFTIPPHALPNLAFATNVKDSNYYTIGYNIEDTLYFDQYWKPYGDELSRNVSSDTLPLSLSKTEKMWAGRSYPVYIMYAEEWAAMYSGIPVTVTTSDPMLQPCDSMGDPITEILLEQGRASFYVKGLGEVINATLTVSSPGAENKSVDWTHINMAVPPVPQIETAYIFDRTGDGRADSIWIQFTKPLGGQSVLDSAKFIFGGNYDRPYKAIYKDGDMTASIFTDAEGFGSAIFTGGAQKAYTGKITVYYTYTDDAGKATLFPVEGALTDRVGPIILAAEVEYMNDGNTQLKLTFSEGLDYNQANTEMFRFHCWKNGIQDSIVKPASDIGTIPFDQWTLVFPKGSDLDIIPVVGDSVRFTPPSQNGEARDLLGVPPHENNPWVRITGEQRITVTSPAVVTLTPGTESFEKAKEIIRSDSATIPKILTGDNISAEAAAAEFGTQGHFLGDLDMAELVENEIAEIVKEVQGTSIYHDKEAMKKDSTSAAAKQGYTLEEILNKVSAGEISIEKAKKKYGVSETIVDAYKSGLLTKENLKNYAHGTETDVKNIVAAVADKTVLRYKTTYYTSLGHFVNEESGAINCNADIYKADGAENCLGSDGRLFLAWNMRSASGRLAATGVYIARIQIKVTVNTKVITDRTQDFLWGVRRGQVNAIDLGL
ncbi:fibro-slime domain-containing protein [Fibrobacter sp. UWR4]|nr:fibro-slime domain-containing protein [Fibrobacter sp. UWR4]PZW68108.1 fibro-slime domain-containing protein [Fibrobacter sp. UWR1]